MKLDSNNVPTKTAKVTEASLLIKGQMLRKPSVLSRTKGKIAFDLYKKHESKISSGSTKVQRQLKRHLQKKAQNTNNWDKNGRLDVKCYGIISTKSGDKYFIFMEKMNTNNTHSRDRSVRTM